MFGKLLGFVNDKASSVRTPRNYMGESVRFDLIEYGMEFHGKRHANTAAASGLVFFLIIVIVGIVARMIVIVVHHEVAIVLFG